jgi:cytochrome c-type biogenesis protein CcmH/NrfG
VRDAEAAAQANQTLRQLSAADLALRADPDNVRARYLLGDALIKSGDIEKGCKYLAGLKRVATAHARARAAGCADD